MSPDRHPNQARPIMTPTPESLAEEARLREAHPHGIKAADVVASIRSDAARLLPAYARKAQRQRGPGSHKHLKFD